MLFTSDDVTRIRSEIHDMDPLIFNAVPLVPIATAQVNQASFTYPLAAITVDNTANWVSKAIRGRLFSIGTAPGFSDITWGVCRKNSNSTTLFCDAKSLGDPGYAREVHAPILDNYYITVYKYRPPWGLLSSIRAGIFYKQYDIPYDGSGSRPDPWPQLGEWRQGFVGDDNKVRFTFSIEGSRYWNSSFSACLWDSDGAAFSSGSASSPSCEMEFGPGFYEISCKLTSANGRTRTGYRYVWANTKNPSDVNSPLSYRYTMGFTSDTQDRTGRNGSVDFSGPLNDLTLFPGQAFYLKENATFNDETLDRDDLRVSSYVGYATEKLTSVTRQVGKVSVKVMSPMGAAAKVPTATQLLEEVLTPIDWTQCTRVLSNPIGAFWYLAAHHAPYLVEAHDADFTTTLVNDRRKSYGFQSVDLGGQFTQLAAMILGNIGCKSNGRIRMLELPQYYDQAQRDILEDLWTWTPDDITGEFTIPFQYRTGSGQVFGYAFSYDGSAESTPYAALAPGYAKAQNPTTVSMTPFQVPFENGQDTCERKTGHHHARLANPTPDFTLKPSRNMDFTEPCDVDMLHELGVDASYDPEDVGWTGKKILPTRVVRSWTPSPGNVKKISITFEVVTLGQKGIFQPVDRGGANVSWTNVWNPGLEPPYQPEMPDLGLVYPVMLAVNDAGLLGRTATFTQRFVFWQKINVMAKIAGIVRDVVINPQSPFILETGPQIEALVVSDVGNVIHVYRIPYVNQVVKDGGTILSLELTTFTADSTYNGKVQIRASKETPHFFLVAWKDGTGVRVSHSVASYSWSSPVHIGATLSPKDLFHANDDLGVDILGETQVILAPNGSADTDGHYIYLPYWASDKLGTTWAVVDNVPTDFHAILGSALLTSVDDAYIAMMQLASPTPPDPLGIVTFDVGGYAHYNTGIYSIINTFHGSNTEYNPINGFRGNGVVLSIDLGADYEFKSLAFAWGASGDMGSPSNFIYTVNIVLQNSDHIIVGEKNFAEDAMKDLIDVSDFDEISDYVRYITLAPGLSFDSFSVPGIWYFWIDDIDVQADLITYDQTKRLYRIGLIAGVWNDVSPTQQFMPEASYAMDIGNTLSLVARDVNRYNYLFAGQWIKLGRTKYIGIKRGTDSSALIGFGYNAIDLSPDKGATKYARIGDWSAKVGPVGIIKVVSGVI